VSDDKLAVVSEEIETESGVTDALVTVADRCTALAPRSMVAPAPRCELSAGHEGDHLGNDGIGTISWQNDDITYDDIISAIVAQNPIIQEVITNQLLKRAPIVYKQPLQKAQPLTISFGPVTVPPYTSVSVQEFPQCFFRGENIINTGSPEGLVIEGAYVGRRSQFATYAEQPIPLSTYDYSELSRGTLFDTCEPASAITFQIRNMTDKPLVFAVDVPGKAVL
jgi:hypothetical protein